MIAGCAAYISPWTTSPAMIAASIISVAPLSTQSYGAGPAAGLSPRCAILLMHGTDDAIVPLALGRSYVAAHPAAGLVEVEGGHFAVIDPRSTAWPELLAALASA